MEVSCIVMCTGGPDFMRERKFLPLPLRYIEKPLMVSVNHFRCLYSASTPAALFPSYECSVMAPVNFVSNFLFISYYIVDFSVTTSRPLWTTRLCINVHGGA